MKQTLLFFKWTANHWEQLGDACAGEPTMDGDMAAGIRAYTAQQAVLYQKLINIFIQDWYKCLETKSLGSEWLSKYPHPEICQWHWLPLNILAYHFPTPLDSDEMDNAVTYNLASDSEDSAIAAASGDVKVDFFDNF